MNKIGIIFSALIAPGLALANNDHYIYTLLNQSSGNEVQTYVQESNGHLKLVGQTATGGLGTGQLLASQGSLAFSSSGRFLFAVNAGDNTVSLFAVSNGALSLLDVEPSGGISPISVTESDGLVYVLNQGSANTIGNIQGFANFLGNLILIPKATAPVSGIGVSAEEIKFTPNGAGLVVAEKVSNIIDTYKLSARGLPAEIMNQNSVGETPYGFDFDKKGHLFVTNAVGGATNASTVTSYSLSNDLELLPISKNVPTMQSSACWAVVSPNSEFLYTADAASGTVSGYDIKTTGAITLDNTSGIAGTTGGKSLDEAMSSDGEYLYVLSAINQQITTFKVGAKGKLTMVDVQGSLPNGTSGLVAN